MMFAMGILFVHCVIVVTPRFLVRGIIYPFVFIRSRGFGGETSQIYTSYVHYPHRSGVGS
jgi:hypothetical protein